MEQNYRIRKPGLGSTSRRYRAVKVMPTAHGLIAELVDYARR